MDTIQPLASELLQYQQDASDFDHLWDETLNALNTLRLSQALGSVSLESMGDLGIHYSQEDSQAAFANAKEKIGESLEKVNASAVRTMHSSYRTLNELRQRYNNALNLVSLAQRQTNHDETVSLKSIQHVHFKGRYDPQAVVHGLDNARSVYEQGLERYTDRALAIFKIAAGLDRRAIAAARRQDQTSLDEQLQSMASKSSKSLNTQIKRQMSQFKEINHTEFSGGHLLVGASRDDPSLKLVVASAKAHYEVPTSDTLATPRPQALTRVLDQSAKLIAIMDQQKDHTEQLIEQSRKTLKLARTMVEQMGQSKPLDRMISSNDVKFLHTQIKGNKVVQLARAQRHLVKLIKASLEYVESGVKAYGISRV